jgi:hypothetical protein
MANKPPETAFVDFPEALFWTGGLERRITCAEKKQK